MARRIGVTIGDVMERQGDLLGDGVNIAARLQGLATPGGIRVSRSVHEQVANKLSVVFSDLGPQDIKNIPQSVHAYRVELEKGVSEQTLIATAEAQLEGLNRQRSAEVPRTLPPRKRNIFGGIGVRLDTPAMGTLVAACLVLLVGGVTWFWTSSREQPVTTVPLSQADLLKILEPFVNTESRTDQAREYAKTKIHRALAYAPVAKATVRTGGWSTQELAAERNIERCVTSTSTRSALSSEWTTSFSCLGHLESTTSAPFNPERALGPIWLK